MRYEYNKEYIIYIPKPTDEYSRYIEVEESGELIRCNDCVAWMGHICHCAKHDRYACMDDYCSWAEPREVEK